MDSTKTESTKTVSTPILAVQGLCCTLSGTQILSDVSFTVTQGETVGIIGPNGSGKTTLFNCLSGFNQSAQGTIAFLGKDISQEYPYTRAQDGLGRVFQNFGIFREMTVLENMLVALESKSAPWKTLFPWSKTTRAAKVKALELLAPVNLTVKADAKASSLSGGQMRLLEIVRAIAFGAELLLLDEPTAGVSPKMKEDLALVISKLKELNKTVLVIEHDITFIQKFCGRIIVFDGGKLVLDDTPEKVRADPRLQEIYFGKGNGQRAA